MLRSAFTMKLKPGCKAEYKKRHDEIWPELSSLLHDSGVRDYSIYLDEQTNTLFATLKLTEDNTAATISGQAIMQKWWDYMADIMAANPDNSPVQGPLLEVFHLD
ncbi:MAG: L-rhamnose mutarotase [Sedimentisphaerales bacterium]|nr:L-rhamnose mutarotase [Sedimentisphaerales bacterium]MBN2843836.1 L-rhamnose mutarotase [Sedimentisphaerales bacterium]